MSDLFDIYFETLNQIEKQENTTSVEDKVVSTEATSNIVTTDVSVQKNVLEEVNQVEITPTLDEKQEEVSKQVEQLLPVEEVKETIRSPVSFTTNNSNSITEFDTNNITSMDAVDLMKMEFPDVTPLVDELLYLGLAILASEPKTGKSWFCLQLCLSLVTSKPFLGLETHKCEVLYYALEDNYRRLQTRLRILLQNEEAPIGIHFETNPKTLDEGFLEDLQGRLDSNNNIKLVIVDTFQYIRGTTKGGGTLYNKEYKEMSKLKEFADKNKVCILLVHHLNKKSKKGFDSINGSTAIRGATDTNIILSSMQDDTSKVLMSVEGRDIESTTKIIQLNAICTWELVEDDVDVVEMKYRENPIVKVVTKMLDEKSDEEETLEVTSQEIKDKMIADLGINEVEYSSQAITREIAEHLIPLFMQFDNIRCKRPNVNGGSNGRKWHFWYQKDESIAKVETTEDENIV